MRYTNSHLEDWIENLYRKIDMTEPEQINFERIAEALDIRLSFKPVTSFALKHSGIYNICLDSRNVSQIEKRALMKMFHEFYRAEKEKAEEGEGNIIFVITDMLSEKDSLDHSR
ncbi:skin element YqaB [Bacillus sp. FW1]|nr:skin element YqaB [Bacillus sp. FW1]